MNFKEKTRNLVNNSLVFNNLVNYVEQIETKNKVMNLTRFKGDTLWQHGIYESIVTLERAFATYQDKKLLDIGSGAGFPSVPFVIVHPEIELIIFEPQTKKLEFLLDVVDEAQINARIQPIRVEESKMFRYFDYIVCRAVSQLKNLIEASNHVGKLGAKFVFIKGPKAKEELKQAKKICKTLDIKPEITRVREIENKEVNIVHYVKNKTLPKGLPREWKKIIKDK